MEAALEEATQSEEKEVVTEFWVHGCALWGARGRAATGDEGEGSETWVGRGLACRWHVTFLEERESVGEGRGLLAGSVRWRSCAELYSYFGGRMLATVPDRC